MSSRSEFAGYAGTQLARIASFVVAEAPPTTPFWLKEMYMNVKLVGRYHAQYVSRESSSLEQGREWPRH